MLARAYLLVKPRISFRHRRISDLESCLRHMYKIPAPHQPSWHWQTYWIKCRNFLRCYFDTIYARKYKRLPLELRDLDHS